MKIRNNSSGLTFEVTLTPVGGESITKTIAPMAEGLDLSHFFATLPAPASTSSTDLSTQYTITISNAGELVRRCELYSSQVYVALLGPAPHVIIHVDGEEAQSKYDEYLRRLETTPMEFPEVLLIALAARMPTMPSLTLIDNDIERFMVIQCYNQDLFTEGPRQICQFWTAFKEIYGIDPETPLPSGYLKMHMPGNLLGKL